MSDLTEHETNLETRAVAAQAAISKAQDALAAASALRGRLEAAITYLERDAAGDAKGKWAKGYRQACADHVAVLRLVLAAEGQ